MAKVKRSWRAAVGTSCQPREREDPGHHAALATIRDYQATATALLPRDWIPAFAE
jgi:hypothetical protein